MIGDPHGYGLDALFPAFFLALLVPQLARAGATTAAVLGALIAVVLIPVARAGVPIIAAVFGVAPKLAARWSRA